MAFVLLMAIFVAVNGLVTVPKWLIQPELHQRRNVFRQMGLASKERLGILHLDGSTPSD